MVALINEEPRYEEMLPHAALSAVLSLLPVPFVDDYAIAAARGALLKRVAVRHGLKIDRMALAVMSHSYLPPPALPVRATLKIAQFMFRKFFVVTNLAAASNEGLRTFVLGHLFDRYCSTFHDAARSEWITEPEGIRIRAAVDSGVRRAAAASVRDIFKQVAWQAWVLLSETPGAVKDVAEEVWRRESDEDAQHAVEDVLREEVGFLTRIVDRAATGMSEYGERYLRSVETAFEEGLEIPSATRHIEVTAEAAPRRAKKKATAAEEAHRSNGAHHRRRRREARP